MQPQNLCSRERRLPGSDEHRALDPLGLSEATSGLGWECCWADCEGWVWVPVCVAHAGSASPARPDRNRPLELLTPRGPPLKMDFPFGFLGSWATPTRPSSTFLLHPPPSFPSLFPPFSSSSSWPVRSLVFGVPHPFSAALLTAVSCLWLILSSSLRPPPQHRRRRRRARQVPSGRRSLGC